MGTGQINIANRRQTRKAMWHPNCRLDNSPIVQRKVASKEGAAIAATENNFRTRNMLPYTLLMVFILVGDFGWAQNKKSESHGEEQLVLGFMNGLFSDIHISDALAATKVNRLCSP